MAKAVLNSYESRTRPWLISTKGEILKICLKKQKLFLRNLRQLEPDGNGWHGEGVTVYENAVCHAPGFEATLLIPVFGFVIISGVTSS